MNILIDTHIFLWALSSPKKLAKKHREELETPTNAVWVSAISIAEIAIKSSLGKLSVPDNLLDASSTMGFENLPFAAEDAMELGALPFHHRDPFDRMLIAQSLARGYTIMTVDSKFEPYECQLL